MKKQKQNPPLKCREKEGYQNQVEPEKGTLPEFSVSLFLTVHWLYFSLVVGQYFSEAGKHSLPQCIRYTSQSVHHCRDGISGPRQILAKDLNWSSWAAIVKVESCKKTKTKPNTTRRQPLSSREKDLYQEESGNTKQPLYKWFVQCWAANKC